MMELTKRQKEILDFIKQCIVSNGYPPTVREIGEALGLSSPATIQNHLDNLVAKGYIRKDGSKNRTIELLVKNEFLVQDEKVASVPLLGMVTAGNPIEAIERADETFDLPAYMIPKRKEIFTLEISGDSMVDKGIFDGDYIVVERCSNAKNGEMVVAMTSDNEVTLKTYYKEDKFIRLQPANDAYEPIILQDVAILGKAIGLYRKF